MILPSYHDLMRAFLTLREGEKDHDLEAQTGLPADHPDLKRIIQCSTFLRLGMADAEDGDMPYTVLCQQSDGRGTVYIETVLAKNSAEAQSIALNNCAVSWGWSQDDIRILGIIDGPAPLFWEDCDDDR